MKATEIHLARRPQGDPVPEDFREVTVRLPDPGPGQLLVRNVLMSVDPYMRVRMAKLPTYPAWEIGDPLDGSAIGVVVSSADPALPTGTVVSHRYGWRDHALVSAADLRTLPSSPGIPLTAHLDVLGMTGLTAYVGLRRIAGLRAGESVHVSGAAGAVGTATGQIARILGAARVTGSAGSAEKVAYLTGELGYDAAFDYHTEDLSSALGAIAPDGFEVYFDNVGGDHLEAALNVISPHGRIAVCGASSAYSAPGDADAPGNLIYVLTKRLRMEGFNVREHLAHYEGFVTQAAQWMHEGTLHSRVTVIEGLSRAVEAFQLMLKGAHRGKMLVRLSDDPV
ncbi:NADP-dependent oxidoreductase [Actinomadura darangshiensis]|uniref:NADP-dependent oxidoreductase n=1 Tax=Actinomadura darangshiensis TaxID=705336 RepID=A0A4V2YWX9_9ACTN|nr:NADP-dependent oxidoreductase [Actinomadura darangshiensis]TDD87187.1 NADP-dependent oxidoreductase [Actinomadura darangshiensis]